jgi:VanZ family protein
MIKSLDALVLLGYCGLIYWLSDQSSLPVPDLFSWQDKLEHFGAYLVMSVLAWRCFSHYAVNFVILALVSFAFCSLHGGLDEWHQSFVAGRVSDVTDWLADTLGAMLGVFLWYKRGKAGADLSALRE